MDDIASKMKGFFDRSVEVSKSAISKAGEKVQDFGDKSVVRIEITQLQGQVKKQIHSLGLVVYEKLVQEKKEGIGSTDEGIADQLAEITRLNKEIDEREKKLEKN